MSRIHSWCESETTYVVGIVEYIYVNGSHTMKFQLMMHVSSRTFKELSIRGQINCHRLRVLTCHATRLSSRYCNILIDNEVKQKIVISYSYTIYFECQSMFVRKFFEAVILLRIYADEDLNHTEIISKYGYISWDQLMMQTININRRSPASTYTQNS